MMTSVAAVDNVAFEMNRITPNKRKRDAIAGGGVAHDPTNKENHIYAAHNGYMEVKSLADLLPAKDAGGCSNNNAFEVQRKPPKKRTKLDQAAVEQQGFVNAGLNLNGPDHVVNPFEIRRGPERAPIESQNCFVNTALNIRGPEKEVRNPFEIVRPHGNSTTGINKHLTYMVKRFWCLNSCSDFAYLV